MPKNELLWTEKDWQNYKGDVEWHEGAWQKARQENIVPVAHKAEVTLCYVSGNEVGDRVYGLYIEDTKGLEKPIGFEMIILADGTVRFDKAEIAMEILSFLKPELVEQLEREEKEEFQREQTVKQQSNG